MQVDAFRTLVAGFGASFAPGHAPPAFEAELDGTHVRLRSGSAEIVEPLTEWKRACGRLWAPALLSPAQLQVTRVLLPTLSEFDGGIWEPMQQWLTAAEPAVAKLAAALLPDHPVESLCCQHSAAFGHLAYATPLFDRGPGAKARAAAFESRGALSAMALVKLALEHVHDDDPLERLRSLVWLREATGENPAALLGIHRMLARDVVPLAKAGTGLWREAATSVLERWTPRLVNRGAHPEALPLLDLLLAYGVNVARFLALRYETLLALNEPSEAERTFEQLRALADAEGHLHAPIDAIGRHVDDVRAVALWSVAKQLRKTADGAPFFAEKRLKKEPGPPPLDADALSRDYAARAVDLLERRAKEPVVLRIPVNHGFFLAAAKKLR